jgi:hypothetical protein
MGVAILSLALAAGAPAAEREDVSTTIRIAQLTASRANGNVFAKEKECRDERIVFLFRVTGGGQPADRIAIGKTSKSGAWTIHTPLAPGNYYAIAPNQREGEFNCRADKSPVSPLAAPA